MYVCTCMYVIYIVSMNEFMMVCMYSTSCTHIALPVVLPLAMHPHCVQFKIQYTHTYIIYTYTHPSSLSTHIHTIIHIPTHHHIHMYTQSNCQSANIATWSALSIYLLLSLI